MTRRPNRWQAVRDPLAARARLAEHQRIPPAPVAPRWSLTVAQAGALVVRLAAYGVAVWGLVTFVLPAMWP